MWQVSWKLCKLDGVNWFQRWWWQRRNKNLKSCEWLLKCNQSNHRKYRKLRKTYKQIRNLIKHSIKSGKHAPNFIRARFQRHSWANCYLYCLSCFLFRCHLEQSLDIISKYCWSFLAYMWAYISLLHFGSFSCSDFKLYSKRRRCFLECHNAKRKNPNYEHILAYLRYIHI